jgi:hypothetical protein
MSGFSQEVRTPTLESPPTLRGRVRVGGAIEHNRSQTELCNSPPPRPAPIEGAGEEGERRS